MISHSASQTQKIAANLAKKILRSGPHQKHARVVALVGELGAGKTTFVQGFAKSLGIKHRMVSPTFLIFRRYAIRHLRFANFYHVDVYRIDDPKELEILGFRSLILNTQYIILVEWADKIKKILPQDTTWVRMEHGKTPQERTIDISY